MIASDVDKIWSEMDFPEREDVGGADTMSTIFGLRRFITPDTTYVEIGSHIGMVAVPTLHQMKYKKAVVIEPHTQAREFLEKNIGDKATVLPYAVWDKDEDVTFWDVDDSYARGSVVRFNDDTYKGVTRRKKTGKTFDTIVKELKLEPPFVIKVDVELAEAHVFRGMKNNYENIVFMVMEFMPKYMRGCGEDPEQLLIDIENAGFEYFAPNFGKRHSRSLFLGLDFKLDLWIRRK